MKTRTLITVMTIFALLVSCNQVPDSPLDKATPEEPKKDTSSVGLRPDTVNVSHYILSFVKPKSFAAQTLKDVGEICIYFDAQHYSGYDDADTEQYSALCDQYGDMTYDQQRIFPAVEEKGFCYIANNIVSIDVICETNYDAEHPAGSSLNDICTLEWESPYKHIKSGYTVTHDWPKVENSYWQKDKGSIPFSKPLADCTAEDMILMGDGWLNLCSIKLTKLPLSDNVQLLTIVLEDESGKTYKCSVGPFGW